MSTNSWNRLKLPKKRKITDAERFPDLNSDQIATKRQSVKKQNTEKSNKKCKKIFTQWLNRHNFNENYWELDIETLNAYLSKFWFEARTVNGEHYTTASLGHICYAINRCLVKHDSDYDIVDSPNFKPSQLAFSDACKELKAMGKGHRKSYPAITPCGKLNNYNLSYFC